MPTLEQIERIHQKYGSAKTLGEYLRTLRAVGVIWYDSFIRDGHSEYFCDGNEQLVSGAVHKEFAVADIVNEKLFLHALDLHTQGKTDYMTMVKGLADSGVERWRFDTGALTITYFDKAGNSLLHETVG